jgi:outer membrane protein TolC
MMSRVEAWCVAGLLTAAVLGGCASFEASKTPPIPKASAPAAPESGGSSSPPALKQEVVAQLPAPQPSLEPGKTLNLTVEGAIVLALQNNQDLSVQEVNPALQQTFVSEARSVFDPVLVGGYTYTDDHLENDLLLQRTLQLSPAATANNPSYWEPVENKTSTHSNAGQAGVTQYLPTGGDVSLTLAKGRTSLHRSSSDQTIANLVDTETDSPSVSLQVTQSLLRGAGLNVNLATLRQARIDQRLSEYETRGTAENLVSQTEQAYWDYALANFKIGIFENALDVAQKQLDLITEQINVGRLPESERSAADAEVASRQSLLIDARSNLAQARLALLRLLNPSPDALRGTEVKIQSEPVIPEISPDGEEASIELARRLRPDMNQARLLIERDKLEVVKTKNGLLPQLDVFLQLAKDINETEYARSFVLSSQDMKDTHYSTQVGVQFGYPIGNRAARARDQRARLAQRQDRLALANMAQLVEQDIRSAYVEVARARAQIDATAATRKLQEQTLQVETEKFRVGRSNVLLVAQAQRDLLTAQITAVQSRSTYLKAIVNLYRLEGTLLERRGVNCPGREPVVLADAAVPAPAAAATPAVVEAKPAEVTQ